VSIITKTKLGLSPGDQHVSSALLYDLQAFQVPLRILQHRWTSGDHPMEHGFIQWSHTAPELATWELLITLRQQLPRPGDC
jgi:hypothetical protein